MMEAGSTDRPASKTQGRHRGADGASNATSSATASEAHDDGPGGKRSGASASGSAESSSVGAHAAPEGHARAVVDEPTAQLLGWIGVAVVTLLTASVRVPLGNAGISVRLLAHVHDVGQHLAAGLVSAFCVAAVLRWGPPSRTARWGMFALAAAVLGAWLLRDDLVGLSGPKLGRSIAVAALASLGAPAAALVARALARRIRWLVALGAIALGALNSLIFARAYLSLHLWLSWIAALSLAAAWAGLPVPSRLAGGMSRALTTPRSPRREDGPAAPRGGVEVRHLLTAAACLWAAWSLVSGPSARVLGEMYRAPGMAFAPLLARAKLALAGSSAEAEGEWYRDRSSLPDVPPTASGIGGPGSIVLLLTIDAFRHDVLTGETYRDKLPVMHAMRDEGTWFAEARAPSSSTVPTMAGIFTGKLYSQIYWTEQTGGGRQKLFPHNDETPRLAQLVARSGAATAVVVSGTGFTPRYGLSDHFEEYIDKGLATGIPAAKITSHITARLGRVGKGGLFLFTHYFEPHAPYDRGGPGKTPFEGYVNELAVVDAELGRLQKEIARLGLADRTFIILAGDHGEAFGEHNTTHHGVTIYDELVHVPLLLYGPRVRPRVVSEYVSLMDLSPTILDLYGLPTPPTTMGQSLLPLCAGLDVELTRPVVVESGRFARAMYFPDRTKIIEDRKMGNIELYDLAADPGELRNLASDDEARTAERLGKLRAFFEAHALRRSGYTLPYRP